MAGKAKKVGFKSTKHNPNKAHSDVLKKNDLKPVDRVITDQYKFRVKCRLPYTKGKEEPQNFVYGGTLFVEHASSYVKIFNQVSLGATDTVWSKETYEHEATEMSISIK